MAQMKSITEAPSPSKTTQSSKSPSKSSTKHSPSPPPRGLSSTLSSSSLTQEFLIYLKKEDTNAGEDHDMENWLNFVIQVRGLKDESDTKKKASLLKQIGAKYFTPENGIILGNNELWRRCAATCEKSSETCHSEAEKHVCLAHDDVLSELDKMHLLFLHQRKEKTCVDKMKMCIL